MGSIGAAWTFTPAAHWLKTFRSTCCRPRTIRELSTLNRFGPAWTILPAAVGSTSSWANSSSITCSPRSAFLTLTNVSGRLYELSLSAATENNGLNPAFPIHIWHWRQPSRDGVDGSFEGRPHTRTPPSLLSSNDGSPGLADTTALTTAYFTVQPSLPGWKPWAAAHRRHLPIIGRRPPISVHRSHTQGSPATPRMVSPGTGIGNR